MEVTLYTKPDCGNCQQAKEALRNAAVSYTEMKLHEDFTELQLKALFPTAKTYPVVVVDNMMIGGYDELQKHLNEALHTQNKLLLEEKYARRI